MKKLTLILLVMLILLLCACGSSTPTPETNTPDNNITAEPDVTAPTDTPVNTPAPDSSEESETEDESDDSTVQLKDIANSFIGKDVSELYAEIGYPESSDYAPSCLGDGEDGNLYYDGFTVYTYREGDVETVEYVE